MDYFNKYAAFPWNTGSQYPNPWFNVANQFVPRNLKDLIRWVKYITLQSPTVTEVLRKFSTYPITDFVISTKSKQTKETYEGFIKNLKLKEILQDIGFQYWTLGNVFISLYFPITRTLTCPSCSTAYNVENALWAKFKSFKFQGSCPHCGHTGEFAVKDTKSQDISKINVIIWDPQDISTEYNPLTGQTNYYYNIPSHIQEQIKNGNPLFVNTVPLQVIEAVKNKQGFKFDSRNFFHLKNISTGGSIDGVALPPLLSLFSLVFYQATLRRANEAVAMEYISPLRVVSPASSGTTDPVISTSLRVFKEKIEDALRRHKQDANYVMVSPLPLTYQLIGGEGKSLLVSQELESSEQQLLLSLGVSQELLSGTTNWTSSHIGLRLMENTLGHYTGRLNEVIEWIFDKVSSYVSTVKVEVKLQDAKLLDDDSYRTLVGELYSNKDISKQTLFETIGLNPAEESERMVKEAGLSAATAVRAKMEEEIATFLAARKSFSEISGTEEYQAAMKQATGIMQQLSQMPQNAQNMALMQLKSEDYSMWLLVQTMLNAGQTPPQEEQDPNAEADSGPTTQDSQDAQPNQPTQDQNGSNS